MFRHQMVLTLRNHINNIIFKKKIRIFKFVKLLLGSLHILVLTKLWTYLFEPFLFSLFLNFVPCNLKRHWARCKCFIKLIGKMAKLLFRQVKKSCVFHFFASRIGSIRNLDIGWYFEPFSVVSFLSKMESIRKLTVSCERSKFSLGP